MNNQAVVDQPQERHERRDGDVVADGSARPPDREPLLGAACDGVEAPLPVGAEPGLGTEPAGNLEGDTQPAGVEMRQPTHGGDEAGSFYLSGRRAGVLLGEGEEQRFLVAAVVEDGAAGPTGRAVPVTD